MVAGYLYYRCISVRKGVSGAETGRLPRDFGGTPHQARCEVAGGSGGVRAGRVLCAGTAGERSASGAALRWGTAVPASERVRSALAGAAGGDRDPLTCSGKRDKISVSKTRDSKHTVQKRRSRLCPRNRNLPGKRSSKRR